MPDGMLSFMFSYPNAIPLPAIAVESIGRTVASLSFDRIYGAFWDRVIWAGAHEITQHSIARYLAAIDSSGSSTKL
jgi:hypothetical protein